jgi:ribosomal protein S18 acetylase RimI-like enzyme
MLSPMEVQIRAGRGSRDVNTVVRLHRDVYEGEYGLDRSFVADVATRLAELRRRGWPGPRDGLWIAQAGGRAVGSITLDDQGGGLGQLGHLVLKPETRGAGAGRRLVEQVLEAARAVEYERLQLFTFHDLSAARSLYQSVGFEKVSGERVTRWGRLMEWERYELAL